MARYTASVAEAPHAARRGGWRRGALIVGVALAAGAAFWATIPHPGSLSARITHDASVVVLAYALLVGVALLVARRGPRADRHLARRGYEGWATVTAFRALQPPQATGVIAQISLRLVVPGSPPYSGTLVRAVAPHERDAFRPGSTVPIRVDRRHREHILVRAEPMPR